LAVFFFGFIPFSLYLLHREKEDLDRGKDDGNFGRVAAAGGEEVAKYDDIKTSVDLFHIYFFSPGWNYCK
jgi:hypothetical protein